MYKVLVILIALFYASSAAAQQSNADKGTASLTNQAQEITVVAIPMNMASQVIMDADNYHKAVVTGVEPDMPGEFVEVVAQGVPAHEHVQGNVTKEAITTGAIKDEDRTVIITDHAQPVKPK